MREESTEEKILAAAKKVFLSKGMAGARMQDIADEAGINKALLHYYFRNKEKLFEVIFAAAAQQLFPTINSIFESDIPLFEKIEKFCEEYITVMIENPYLPLFVLYEMSNDPKFLMNKIFQGKNCSPPRKIYRADRKGSKKRNNKAGKSFAIINEPDLNVGVSFCR